MSKKKRRKKKEKVLASSADSRLCARRVGHKKKEGGEGEECPQSLRRAASFVTCADTTYSGMLLARLESLGSFVVGGVSSHATLR